MSLDPRRWRPASRDGGSSPVASGQRAGDAPSPRGVAARGAGVRECGHRRLGRRGRRDMRLCYWARPYPQRRYVSGPRIQYSENNKNADTAKIRIQRVSDMYPYPIRIGYMIRAFLEVSV
jgi:hypothetical protein